MYTESDTMSGKFDVLLTLDNGEHCVVFLTLTVDFDTIVPMAGTISGQLKEKVKKTEKQELSLTWEGTGVPSDVYSVWMYAGNPSQDSGWIPNSACGVKEFMTKQEVTISQAGNTYSTTITDLDPQDPYVVTVLVERPGGYQDAYTALIINNAHAMQPAIMVMMLLLLLCHLMYI